MEAPSTGRSSIVVLSQKLAILLVVILVSNLADVAEADLYGNPSPPPAPISGPAPPPPFEVAGKPFPPQHFLCDNAGRKCFGKDIKCPVQCPEFKPADPTAKACFVDCNSPKCEAVCRNRKPNCEGIGAACYDPRFIGGDGIMFYFHGKAEENFALVSDADLQINARFIGRRPEGRSRDNTWIQALGIMFGGTHTLSLAAKREVAVWDDAVDQLEFTYDGFPLSLPTGHLSSWNMSNMITLERTAAANSVTVTLANLAEISVSVVPITEEDNRIHNYQIPADDCFAHLEVQFKFFNLSEGVEGVLGQTYRPEFVNPVKRGVSMPIMGGEHKYKTSALLSPHCAFCIFTPARAGTENIPHLQLRTSPATIDCTSKITNGPGILCRR
ncbi:hypothetical protein H6P81_017871 [Aristolochia fimbriata]|uniref:Root cap n=1 Tax=Aristolochia fimbriata TaxID=158543 RepID=A0AAV7E3P4_ARIFI|nr:hypothetical protein H6P81_017871 [Aristolochia fimbriata]